MSILGESSSPAPSPASASFLFLFFGHNIWWHRKKRKKKGQRDSGIFFFDISDANMRLLLLLRICLLFVHNSANIHWHLANTKHSGNTSNLDSVLGAGCCSVLVLRARTYSIRFNDSIPHPGIPASRVTPLSCKQKHAPSAWISRSNACTWVLRFRLYLFECVLRPTSLFICQPLATFFPCSLLPLPLLLLFLLLYLLLALLLSFIFPSFQSLFVFALPTTSS